VIPKLICTFKSPWDFLEILKPRSTWDQFQSSSLRYRDNPDKPRNPGKGPTPQAPVIPGGFTCCFHHRLAIELGKFRGLQLTLTHAHRNADALQFNCQCWWQFHFGGVWLQVAPCIQEWRRSLIFLKATSPLGQAFKMMKEAQVSLKILGFIWHPFPSTHSPLVLISMSNANSNGSEKQNSHHSPALQVTLQGGVIIHSISQTFLWTETMKSSFLTCRLGELPWMA
jgi:hypothetical protein